jgi:hypothetical protein
VHRFGTRPSLDGRLKFKIQDPGALAIEEDFEAVESGVVGAGCDDAQGMLSFDFPSSVWRNDCFPAFEDFGCEASILLAVVDGVIKEKSLRFGVPIFDDEPKFYSLAE